MQGGLSVRRLLAVMAFLVMCAGTGFSQPWSEKDLSGLEVYRIRGESQYYKDLVANLGDILIAYKYSGLTYRNSLGDFVNALDYAYFLSVRDGKVTFLGKLEKTRIIDAYGKVLYDASKDDPSLFPNVVGISSNIIQTLTQPSLVVLGKEKTGAAFYYETEAVVALDFDVQRKTIVEYKSTN